MTLQIEFTDDEYERLEDLLKYYETTPSNLLALLVFKEVMNKQYIEEKKSIADKRERGS